MLIIPAVDIKEGKCVRLTEGKFEDMEIFSDDPVAVAMKWADKGAKMLHVIDLDGAKYGKLINSSLLEQIVKKVNIPVQVGGGIRNYKEVEKLISMGVSRVILGTVLGEDKLLAKRLFKDFPERVIAGIDARDRYVAIKGWQNTLSIDALDFAGEMESLGTKRIIYTDIKRDGTLIGPNMGNIEKMLKNINTVSYTHLTLPTICSV